MKSSRLVGVLLALGLGGCATLQGGSGGRARAGEGWLSDSSDVTPATAFRVRFARRLSAEVGGRLVPIEHAGVALDPARDRLYVGLGDGTLRALDSNGRELYRYDAGAPIDATPALDSRTNVLYVATNDGTIHALEAATGRRIWRESAGHPLAQDPLLTNDVIFVVSEDDVVSAIARSDGAVLWNYRRPPAEEITIKGHAGLVLSGSRLYTAFNDGVVVALAPADGSVLWELDTSVDLDTRAPAGTPRFRDVDTTPVIVGSKLYVASFAAGLYTLDLESGSVLDRDGTRIGIIDVQAVADKLVLTSADQGVTLFDPETKTARWTKGVDRGSPTRPSLTRGNLAIYGESGGSLIAVRLDNGVEVGRVESGRGFVAPTRSAANLAAVVSNSGTLYVLDLF